MARLGYTADMKKVFKINLLRSSVRAVCFMLLLGFGLSACGPSPEEAQKQILDLGYRYDTDGLIQALDDGEKRAILRFIIADSDREIFRETLFLLAACEDRDYVLVDECLQHVRLLAGYGIDLNMTDDNGDGMVWYAAKAGNQILTQYLMREDVVVGSKSVIDRAKALKGTDFNQERRTRREALTATIEARWNVNAARNNRDGERKVQGEFFRSSGQE